MNDKGLRDIIMNDKGLRDIIMKLCNVNSITYLARDNQNRLFKVIKYNRDGSEEIYI